MATINDTLRDAATQLRAASDAPDLDAARLLLHVLGKQNSSWLLSHPEHQLTANEADEYARLMTERAAGTPLAYILGQWDFYGRPFTVSRHVLIPRPETEDLITAALRAIEDMYTKSGRNITVADVGTGSGCVAITLALESPFIEKLYATDISPDALTVAKMNAERHGVAGRIEFLHGDMLTPLAGRRIDLIVSNPPYIPSSELNNGPRTAETAGLQHEPRLALDGGPDGQYFTKTLMETNIPAVWEATGGTIQTNPAFANI